MENIDKLKKIREILVEKVGENDEDGLVEVIDNAIEIMEPKETDFDILEKRISAWLDNIANNVENTISKDTILSDTEEFIKNLTEKENPFAPGSKLFDDDKFGNEEERENRRKEAFSIWEKEKYSALKTLKYQATLIKSVN